MRPEIRETFEEIGNISNPFPGLRPFEFDESHLFFGRDGQNEQLIRKLGNTRFLAVVGTSGSGKSSLVRAGLLPALLGGFMTSAGSTWRIAILRPGNNPIGSLAAALTAPDVFGSDNEADTTIETAMIEATLRRGRLGLIEAVRQNADSGNANLLVVVDQFEEIFRFAKVVKTERYDNEAAAFVKLLLEASRQQEIPIYVVLTMRSDYLGDCSRFWDLPEAINESQYLIPRLTRGQLREAISGPAAVGGGAITPRLMNRLLNDVGDREDQLPLLQHLLMRMWDEAKEKRLEVGIDDGVNRSTKAHKEVHEGEAIDLCCYEALGGMATALSRHADEAFDELSPNCRVVAEKLFKALTEKGSDNREIRRPITVAEICAVANATEADVITVIERFRQPGRSFLMPPANVALDQERLVDVSHESLIRGWSRLASWVDEESQSARIYRRLAETAELHRERQAGLWGDPDLQLALDWREKTKPNEAWARRYHPGFSGALKFLEESVTARDAEIQENRTHEERKKSIKRARVFVTVLAVLFVLALAALIFAVRQTRIAVRQTRIADVALTEATMQRYVAEEQAKKVANLQEQQLKEQGRIAELERQRAEQQRQLAILAKRDAAEAQEISHLISEGTAKYTAGDITQAVALFIQVQDYYVKRNDQRGELDTLRMLISVYQKLGDESKAEPLAERALSIQERLLGANSPELLTDLESLASLQHKLGHYSAEESVRVRIVNTRERTAGRNSPQLAAALGDLASLYTAEQKLDEAKATLERKLSIEETAFGVNSSRLVPTLSALSTIYRGSDARKSEDLLQRSQRLQGVRLTPLRVGASGPDVRELQRQLKTLGFYSGEIDEEYSAGTREAVAAFQRSQGLAADGIAGLATRSAMANASSYGSKVTVEIVSQIFPGTPASDIRNNLPFVLKALDSAGLADRNMLLVTLATIRVIVGGFAPGTELESPFNTSKGGRAFDLYDNRRDLGNQGPPDGERFKGRGYILLTGRANYIRFGQALDLGNQLIDSPDLASQPDIAARILVSFLKTREMAIRDALASANLAGIVRLLSGGSRGVDVFTNSFRTGDSLLPQW